MKRLFLAVLAIILVFSTSVVFIGTDNTASTASVDLTDNVTMENVTVDGEVVDGDDLSELISVEEGGSVSFVDETVAETEAEAQAGSNESAELSESEYALENAGLTGEFDGHTVAITGNLPEGATLSLTEVDMETADKLVTEMFKKEAVFACDIKIIDADGNQWQPDESVKVTVSDLTVGEEQKLGFLHISQDIETVVAENNVEESVEDLSYSNVTDGCATFETTGFSVFVGYTVDFHFGDETYSIAGESSVLLSTVFEKLGIDKDAKSATAVEFSTPDLLSFEQQTDGDWLITSLAPFSTDETLTITFPGEVFEMLVTDAWLTADATWDGGELAGGTVKSASGIDVNITFTGSVYVKNTITVAAGTRLVITAKNNNSNKNFFRKTNFDGPIFQVNDGASLVIDGSAVSSSNPQLTIRGEKKTDGNTDAVAVTATDSLIRLTSGTETYPGSTYKYGYLQLINVTMKNVTSNSSGKGAGIQINGTRNFVEIKDCTFSNIKSTNDEGGAIKVASEATITKTLQSGKTSDRAGKILITNSSFTDCYAKRGGAIATNNNSSGSIETGLYVTNCKFSNCEATTTISSEKTGGAIYISSKITDFYVNGGSSFKNCTAHRGGAIYFSGIANITNRFSVEAGSKFEECKAECTSTCISKHTDTEFEGTTYTATDGGAICAHTASGTNTIKDFNIGSATFTDCIAGSSGGAIFTNANHNTFGVSPPSDGGAEFKNCTAGNGGGGICLGGQSNVSSEVKININTSSGSETAGIHDTADYKVAYASAQSKTKFYNCKGTNGGGALLFRGKAEKITVRGVLIDSCTGTNGSAIFLQGNTADIQEMEMINTVVRNCNSYKEVASETVYGGTIRTTGPVSCNLTMDNCKVYNNKSWLQGGGLYWNAAGTDTKNGESIVKVTNDCVFDSNHAVLMGGGIFCESKMEISDTTVMNNSAGTDGGGIAQTVYNNKETNWCAEETNLTLGNNVVITNNKAAGNGGGIAMVVRTSNNVYAGYSGDTTLTQNANYDFTLSFTMADVDTDPVVYNNIAGNYGGGIYFGTGSSVGDGDGEYSATPISEDAIRTGANKHLISYFRDDDKKLTNEENQGLIDLYNKDININAGEIYNNSSGADGGGIYAKGKELTINVSNGLIYNNDAGQKDYDLYYYFNNVPSSSSNTAKQIVEDTETTDGFTEVHNTLCSSTLGIGGGICIRGDSAKCIFSGGCVGEKSDGTKSANIADSGGGVAADQAAIYIDSNEDGTAKTSTSYIRYNEAIRGGGVFVDNGGKIVMAGGYLSNNKAIREDDNTDHSSLFVDGGGAYITGAGSQVTLNGGHVENNTSTGIGGGVAVVGYKTDVENAVVSAYLNGGTIANNESTDSNGGGVCSCIDGSAGGTISTLIEINGTVLNKNRAKDSGGGIGAFNYDTSAQVTQSTIKVTDGEITNNSTTNFSGGAILANKSKIEVSGGNIGTENNGNTANYRGGGIYAEAASTVTITGGKISYNKTEETNDHDWIHDTNGGGIAAVGDSIVTVDGGDITYNTAKNGGGGGIYADGGSDVTVMDGYITNNIANYDYTRNDSPYQNDELAGIGGGICLGSGESEDNPTTFSLPISEDGDKALVGIYDNYGYYAADDVFANGKYTKLDVPEFNQMTIEGKGDGWGWYEDYANQDANYSLGTALDKTVADETNGIIGATGSRYKNITTDSITTNDEYHSRKYLIEYVNNPATVSVLSDETQRYVNDANTYVSMTLGEITKGFIEVSKTVTSKNSNLEFEDETQYQFQILHVVTDDGTITYEPLTDAEIAATEEVDGIATPVIYYTVEGSTEKQALTSSGAVLLKGGQKATIVGLTPDYYVVKEVEADNVFSTSNTYYPQGASEDDKVTVSDNQTGVLEPFNGLTYCADYTNVLNTIKVVIKYYNRDYSTSGDPADIDSEATEYSAEYVVTDKYTSFSNMITNTVVMADEKYALSNNILDKYICYPSQAQAESEIGSYHTSNYDVVPTTGTEADKWVTYTQTQGESVNYRYEADETAYTTDSVIAKLNNVDTVTVWLRNTLRPYKYNVYQASELSDLTQIGTTTKYIAKSKILNALNTNDDGYVEGGENATTGSANVAYYNQRFGIQFNSGTSDGCSDESTNHLTNRGKTAWLGINPDTAEEITDGSGTKYVFSYWAFDEAGTQIASTELLYPYHITGDLELYAVYEKDASTVSKGLTVTQGVVDVYTDASGTPKTAINTIMNPYNCQINDSNILKVGVIYVIDSKGNVAEGGLDLNAEYTNADGTTTNLNKIREVIQAKLTSSISGTTETNDNVVLSLSAELSALGITRGTCRVYYVADGTVLTNRNRVQFTESFSTTALKNRRIYAFSAMYYAGDENQWIVSDNCIDYKFDADGKFTK